MKKGIHPVSFDVIIKCICGASFETYSTVKEIKVGLCSQCHPFYTGDQKFIDTEGRIEKFRKRYKK